MQKAVILRMRGLPTSHPWVAARVEGSIYYHNYYRPHDIKYCPVLLCDLRVYCTTGTLTEHVLCDLSKLSKLFVKNNACILAEELKNSSEILPSGF